MYVFLYILNAPEHPDEGLLPIFIPLQANCCGEAAGFQVIRCSQVDEQNEIRWKNTLIFEHEFPVYSDACLNF